MEEGLIDEKGFSSIISDRLKSQIEAQFLRFNICHQSCHFVAKCHKQLQCITVLTFQMVSMLSIGVTTAF